MALTTYLISKASDHLNNKSIELWISLFRQLPRYKENAVIYTPELESRLIDAEGTLKARQLNALMSLIDDLGPGEVKIQGDRQGVWFSQTEERLALIEEAFNILFDDISTMVSYGTVETGYEKTVAVGQRDSVSGLCSKCHYHSIWNYGLCRTCYGLC
jgi:hypothetical protein